MKTKALKPVRRASLEELAEEKKTMTCISLFTGAGGAALGVRAAGFEVRVMVEWEKSACNTLRMNWVERPDNWREVLAAEEKRIARRLKRIKNDRRQEVVKMQDTPPYWWQERPPAIMNVDISKTSTADILAAAQLKVGEASLLEGGFPCQGFSMAGKRVIDDPRNALYKECVRIIREALPHSFLLENVPGLISMNGGETMKQICEDLAAVGYDVNWNLLNAADFGVPQNRKRVFFVGSRNDFTSFDFKTGRTRIYMGALKGKVTHPDFFLAKHKDLVQPSMV